MCDVDDGELAEYRVESDRAAIHASAGSTSLVGSEARRTPAATAPAAEVS